MGGLLAEERSSMLLRGMAGGPEKLGFPLGRQISYRT